MDASPDEVRTDVLYQIGALAGMARACGCTLQHVKPHGALYNTAHAHQPTAQGIIDAVAAFDSGLILVTLAGPGGEMMRELARAKGLKCAKEAFADRSYTPEGRLTPRGSQGAVVHDPKEVAERCLRMAQDGSVEAVSGEVVKLDADTICVHGDNPSAVELVKSVKGALERAGVELMPLGAWL